MAVDYSRTARQIAFTLEVKSPNIFKNIFLNNGVLYLLGSTGRVKIVRGGNRFDERVQLGQNSNVAFRSPYSQIATVTQDNVRTAQYGQATIDGAAVINFVEEDQNAGEYRISDLAQYAIDELMGTFPNKVADALLAATSGANDPLSIREEIQATAYGSQTRTTGGIARSDFPGSSPVSAWQNQYSNTSADLSAAAGIATATKFAWACSPGGSALSEQPDIMLSTVGVLAKASGAADVLRRFSVDDKLVKYGFTSLMINNARLIADRNVPTSAGYFLNSNYMRIQVLGGSRTKTSGDVKVIGDGAVSVPLQICKPVESDDYLQEIIKAYLVMNLTLGGLRQHGLMDNLTEA